MIRLRVLGSLDLRDDDGGELRSVLMQPKRLSLLLYLVLARPRGFLRRDTLIGLFWPDVASDRARASLNQAVHVLRRSLGAEVIVSRGTDELAVSPDHFACDAWEFDADLAAGVPERALALYHGDLLPGFSAEVPEFEQWLETERREARGRALQGLQDLTERAEGAGDVDGAITWARRALALAPYDEPALVRLMQLLARKGDRAAAIRTCEEFSERLWNDVELKLSPATREVLSRIRRDAGMPETKAPPQPSKAPAPAEQPKSAAAAPPAPLPASTSLGEPTAPVRPVPAPGAGFRRRWAWIGALLLLALGGGGAVAVRLYRAKPAAPAAVAAPTRVAVMYFDVTDSTQALRALADGLTEQLIDQLSHVDPLEVISRNGVRPFRGRTVSPDSIRRALSVPLFISGSVSRSGDSVRVTVSLADATTGSTLYSQVIDRRWDEPFALMDALSEEVGQFLRNQLGREIRLTQARRGTANVAAWDLYRRARTLRLEAEAAGVDGRDAVAAGLNETADSLMARASRLDPEWTDPLLDRGRIAFGRAWRAFVSGKGPAGARAEAETGLGFVNRALALHPGAPDALELRGTLTYAIWTLARPPGPAGDDLGRSAEKDLRAALAVDPQRAQAWAILSAMEIDRWHLAESKADAERAYQVDSYLFQGEDVVHRLFMTSFEMRQDADARRYCDEWQRRFGQKWEWAICRLLLLGWADPRPDPATAWKVYDEPSRVDGPAMRAATRPMLAMLVAASLARAGLADSARHVMASAHAAGSSNPEVLRLESAVELVLGDTAASRQLLADYYARSGLPVARQQMTQRSRIFASPPRIQASTAGR